MIAQGHIKIHSFLPLRPLLFEMNCLGYLFSSNLTFSTFYIIAIHRRWCHGYLIQRKLNNVSEEDFTLSSIKYKYIVNWKYSSIAFHLIKKYAKEKENISKMIFARAHQFLTH